ncbi:MAG: hypothetical protein M3O74_10910 [Pseudomonadota bacterium]|uniref:hypothetical protein n=1 Tax=Burkholderia sp. PAMC 28687 TaxID=1795874 RepID=UPI000782BA8F|nr:hypothetical protein [Burkholderia sp. PAMC 28687]AMM13197.1 hypothetical protein AX768_02790 [Burkholderia sp. PAMC 28687]MDP9154747.1 hypothetical protein [Pseudomonadota bacterium]
MPVLRIFFSLLLAMLSTPGAFAQDADSGAGPIRTVAGSVTFVQQGNGIDAQLDGTTFDRLSARRIVRHVEPSGARMIVEASDGGAPELLLYDFTKRPPAVERIGRRMKLTGVFWQHDEVVLKSAEGWYRFQRGTLTKLTSSKTVYH